MYVLQFFVHAISSAAKRTVSLYPRSQHENELVPLVSEDGDEVRYASFEEEADSAQPELLGLTADYETWFGSTNAWKNAMAHLAVYLLMAIIGFSFVLEKWPIHDSIYFAVVVFTTVGYGDLSPTNDLSRVFVIFFAIYGIVILGIFLGLLGELIIKRHDENLKKRMKNIRIKILEQFGEDDTALPPEERSLFREVVTISLAEAPIVAILVVLGAPIVYLEGWEVIQGVYWMVVTGTTIGFGDLGPTQMVTRCICILWIPLAVAVLGEILGRIAGAYIARSTDAMEVKFLQRAMTLADLRRMDTDNDSKVAPHEFLRYMLVALQKVEKEEIDEILELFKKLDKSNTGFIEKEDLMSNYNFALRPGVTIRASDLPSTL